MANDTKYPFLLHMDKNALIHMWIITNSLDNQGVDNEGKCDSPHKIQNNINIFTFRNGLKLPAPLIHVNNLANYNNKSISFSMR